MARRTNQKVEETIETPEVEETVEAVELTADEAPAEPVADEAPAEDVRVWHEVTVEYSDQPPARVRDERETREAEGSRKPRVSLKDI